MSMEEDENHSLSAFREFPKAGNPAPAGPTSTFRDYEYTHGHEKVQSKAITTEALDGLYPAVLLTHQ